MPNEEELSRGRVVPTSVTSRVSPIWPASRRAAAVTSDAAERASIWILTTTSGSPKTTMWKRTLRPASCGCQQGSATYCILHPPEGTCRGIYQTVTPIGTTLKCLPDKRLEVPLKLAILAFLEGPMP